MIQRHPILISLLLSAAAWGCQKPAENAAATTPTSTATANPTAAPAAEGEHGSKTLKVSAHGDKGKKDEAEESDAGLQTYPVPFAWESSQDEALARTRAFLLASNADNAKYTKEHGAAFFEKLGGPQAPRVTVLTSAEPALQTPAFDLTAEGDVYMVRNLGNQLATNAGAVDYGVRELETPLLMVLGHTGSEAVRMALEGLDDTSPWMKEELEKLELPETTLSAWRSSGGGGAGPKAAMKAHTSAQEAAHVKETGAKGKKAEGDKGQDAKAEATDKAEKPADEKAHAKSEQGAHGKEAHGKGEQGKAGQEQETAKEKPLDEAHAKVWADAVVANVHRQVELALERYSHEVVAGKLTVIGAVFDVRNDLHHGPGALNIVNVNGVTSPETLAAVERTVGGPVKVVLPPKLLAEQQKGLKKETLDILEKILPHSTHTNPPR